MKRNIFNSHLRDVEETYFVHMRHSLGFAWRSLTAGLALIVHAILPFLFKQYGSNQIAKTVKKLKSGKRAEAFNEKIADSIMD